MTIAPPRSLGTPGIDRFSPAQLLRGRSVFNPAPQDPATARDAAMAPGSHAVV